MVSLEEGVGPIGPDNAAVVVACSGRDPSQIEMLLQHSLTGEAKQSLLRWAVTALMESPDDSRIKNIVGRLLGLGADLFHERHLAEAALIARSDIVTYGLSQPFQRAKTVAAAAAAPYLPATLDEMDYSKEIYYRTLIDELRNHLNELEAAEQEVVNAVVDEISDPVAALLHLFDIHQLPLE